MAGTVEVGEGVRWSAASWLFYWVVRTLADEMGESAASGRLKEIDSEHLGYLALDDFPARDTSALRGLIRNRLLNRAEGEWLDFDGRESAFGALRDLVGMTPTPGD